MRLRVPLDRLVEEPLRLDGLSSAEAQRRQTRFGLNEVLQKVAHPVWDLLLQTIKDPMLAFLSLTGAIYLALGNLAEGLSLWASVLPLVLLDGWLHRRTQASVAGLAAGLARSAQVWRDGSFRNLAAEEIVPGDLVRMGAQQTVPADGVVVFCEEAQVDESALTGESAAVRKRALDRLEEFIDDEHWAFAGTRLLAGALFLRVASTGAHTRYGELARLAAGERTERTPLQRSLSRLTYALLSAALLLCLVLGAVRYLRGHGLVDALLSAATLGVAAIPEEFPVALTFFLGTAVFRLARRRALVRRALALENMGRVSVICSDKTGTMTEGKLRLEAIEPFGQRSEEELLTYAALASRVEGNDPLDVAILSVAPGSVTTAERLMVFPFTEVRRLESSLVRFDGAIWTAAKGAPESLLARCELSTESQERVTASAARLSAKAMKVIAVGRARLEASVQSEPTSGLELVGLLGFADPLRPSVPAAIARCRELGIRPIMVTGDHPATARAVATQAGLGGSHPRLLTGDELEMRLSSGALREHFDVVARASPLQKHSLVRALQKTGEVVAVTGDGVNDAPALAAADIGIAMGGRGTQAAREAASMVLLDDDFGSLVAAVYEGRQIFEALRSSFAWLLCMHIPLVLSAAIIPLLGWPLLYLPLHIVWLELVIHPTALLTFGEDRHARVSSHPQTHARFFSRTEWRNLLLSSTLALLGLLLLYRRGLEGGPEHARALAMSCLLTYGACCAAIFSGLSSAISRTIFISILASTALLVQLPAAARFFHLGPLHLSDLAWVVAAAGVASLPLAWRPGTASIDKHPSRGHEPVRAP